jgi:hypothetical protein
VETKAGSRAFIFCTPDGGLIDALFCPADDWKMATIAEFLFIRLFDGRNFARLRLSGKMCRFLHFHKDVTNFGFAWRFVES